MPRCYPKLRARLSEYDYTQVYLCEILDKSTSYIGERMRGAKAWRLDDMYRIMDEFDIPYNKLHKYFPNYFS